ncbi:GNAT family protein [uncultured Pontibacter sp.]|uniref:GNAT family N-acetyltransferase n=1 Tax=uncultured Pontibacter sp. TaxID=453356 RepID=UPI0026285734|nr:GNAT family protein [uncultured Pontibacter sp.]
MYAIRNLYLPDNFPELHLDQLVLRQYTAADAAALNQLRNNEQVNEHLFRKNAETLKQTAEIIRHLQQSFKEQTGINWAIAEKATQQLIGHVGFWKIDSTSQVAELGYLLHPTFWNKGIMTDVLGAVLKYGFDSVGFNRIEAFVKPSNAASAHLLSKTGFKQEALLRDYYRVDDKFMDCLVFGKLASNR